MQQSVSVKTKVRAAYEVGFTSRATALYGFIEDRNYQAALKYIDYFFERSTSGKDRVLSKDEQQLSNIINHHIDERVVRGELK